MSGFRAVMGLASNSLYNHFLAVIHINDPLTAADERYEGGQPAPTTGASARIPRRLATGVGRDLHKLRCTSYVTPPEHWRTGARCAVTSLHAESLRLDEALSNRNQRQFRLISYAQLLLHIV